jgi:hypothetical protein
MRRFAETCEGAAATTERSEKVRLVAFTSIAGVKLVTFDGALRSRPMKRAYS